MTRSLRRLLILPVLAAAALTFGACGEEDIQLAKSDPNYRGAELFHQRCAGCHTLDVAGAQGSATNVRTRELKDGPNFNQRRESVEDVLYAIRNGGFSSGPMPQNIAVGEEAKQVAEFVAKYSGQLTEEATKVDQTGQGGPTQSGTGGP
jgi:mono/diheme cytochrome c family protein